MSATIDTQLFAHYFPTPIQDKLIPAPVLRIEGRMHTVQEFFVDDLRALGEVTAERKGENYFKLFNIQHWDLNILVYDIIIVWCCVLGTYIGDE